MPRGTGKINKAPQGGWFLYEPPPRPGRTPCPGCERGHILTFRVPKTSDFRFECSERGCDWQSPAPLKNPGVSKAVVIQLPESEPLEFHPDPPQLVAAVRAECKRRDALLREERMKFPPSFRVRVTGKKRKLVPNPDFTDEMRAHMHTFAFSAEEIRDRLKKKFAFKA